MIVRSPDALTDIERLRTFPDQVNPGAARRAVDLAAEMEGGIWQSIGRAFSINSINRTVEAGQVFVAAVER